MNAVLDTEPDVAVALEPERNAGHVHWHAGLQFAGGRRWRDAARAFGRAARAAPEDHLYWMNLANAQRHAGALPRAVAAARRGLQHKPGDSLTLRLLGECLTQLHRYDEAEQTLSQLSAQDDAEPLALLQHAAVLLSLQRPGQAAATLLRALSSQPDLIGAHGLLADACRDQGFKREAVECIRTVLALEPDSLEALSRLSFEKRHLCDWSELEHDIERMREALLTAPEGLARIAATFAMLSLPIEPALQLTAARGEALAVQRGVIPLAAFKPAERRPGRLRIGWLSYDFRMHAVAQLLAEVLETLDRERFEVVLYSAGPDDGSPLRRRLQSDAFSFIDIRGMSDEQAAQRVRQDGIDILVDLMGHTRGHRMGILARRPAPVQTAFLGYAGTTGAEFIDYLIGDPFVTPLQLAHDYSEKLAQLPLTFQPNGRDRPLPKPVTRAEAGLPDGAFVMCAFNHTYKILPPAFDTWCAVLHDLPHAVLWLKQTNDQLHGNVRREAERRGISAERILFAPNVSYEQHFSRLAQADVFVDTWPYNGHTTAADALWAGLPVVTLYGNAYASRVAGSVLNAAGIGELAFDNATDYGRAIVALGREPGLLRGYRDHLTGQRMTLPLFDTPRYTAELQSLLQRMAERWQAGLEPEHLLAV